MKNSVLKNISYFLRNIRKPSALLLVLFLNNSLADRSVKFTAPESMKEQVIQILTSHKTDDKILSNFLTIDKLKSILNDEINDKTHKKVSAMTKEKWEQDILENLNELHKRAKELKVDWSTIKVVKFPITLRAYKEKCLKEDIIKGKAKMYFNIDNKLFYIRVHSFLMDGKHKILSIYGLSEAIPQ